MYDFSKLNDSGNSIETLKDCKLEEQGFNHTENRKIIMKSEHIQLEFISYSRPLGSDKLTSHKI